jgi:hypothetical protein
MKQEVSNKSGVASIMGKPNIIILGWADEKSKNILRKPQELIKLFT